MTERRPTVVAFHQLHTWRKAFSLALDCHALVRRLPHDELFVLGAQLRRSALSVPSNIAEGNGRLTTGDYIRFLRIANGSLMELQTQLFMVAALDYVPRAEVVALVQRSNEVGRMLGRMMTRLSERSRGGVSRRTMK